MAARRSPTKPADRTTPGDGGEGYLVGQLLIAMPAMQDPRFARSVICLCAHSAEGAMGIVLNKPLDGLSFDQLLRQLKLDPVPPQRRFRLFVGGPVEGGRGFVLHTADWETKGSLKVTDEIALTASVDILKAIAEGGGPRRGILALGYAGWGPGQLEDEIQRAAPPRSSRRRAMRPPGDAPPGDAPAGRSLPCLALPCSFCLLMAAIRSIGLCPKDREQGTSQDGHGVPPPRRRVWPMRREEVRAVAHGREQPGPGEDIGHAIEPVRRHRDRTAHRARMLRGVEAARDVGQRRRCRRQVVLEQSGHASGRMPRVRRRSAAWSTGAAARPERSLSQRQPSSRVGGRVSARPAATVSTTSLPR